MTDDNEPTADELEQLAQSLAIDGSLGRADTLRVVDVLPGVGGCETARQLNMNPGSPIEILSDGRAMFRPDGGECGGWGPSQGPRFAATTANSSMVNSPRRGGRK